LQNTLEVIEDEDEIDDDDSNPSIYRNVGPFLFRSFVALTK